MDVIRRSFFGAVSGNFTGLKNYINVCSNQVFRLAAKNTVRFFAVCIPTLIILSLIIAVLLNGLKQTKRHLLACWYPAIYGEILDMTLYCGWPGFPEFQCPFMKLQKWMAQTAGNAL